jgi:hypothetical protein
MFNNTITLTLTTLFWTEISNTFALKESTEHSWWYKLINISTKYLGRSNKQQRHTYNCMPGLSWRTIRKTDFSACCCKWSTCHCLWLGLLAWQVMSRSWITDFLPSLCSPGMPKSSWFIHQICVLDESIQINRWPGQGGISLQHVFAWITWP